MKLVWSFEFFFWIWPETIHFALNRRFFNENFCLVFLPFSIFCSNASIQGGRPQRPVARPTRHRTGTILPVRPGQRYSLLPEMVLQGPWLGQGWTRILSLHAHTEALQASFPARRDSGGRKCFLGENCFRKVNLFCTTLQYDKSGGGTIYLRATDDRTSGKYKCEISAEGTFQTSSKEKFMVVMSKLTGGKFLLKPFNLLHFFCTDSASSSSSSRPSEWFVVVVVIFLVLPVILLETIKFFCWNMMEKSSRERFSTTEYHRFSSHFSLPVLLHLLFIIVFRMCLILWNKIAKTKKTIWKQKRKFQFNFVVFFQWQLLAILISKSFASLFYLVFCEFFWEENGHVLHL